MNALAILLFISIGGFVAYQIHIGYKQGTSADEGKMICPACGSQGWPVSKTKGSIGIEIILWLCFIIPGLIYSIWRLTTKYVACPACGQDGMIPLNSPNGKRLSEQFTTPPRGNEQGR